MPCRLEMASSLLLLCLAGCQYDDRVLFVTDTGIGLGYDTKPPYLAIDYHRFEGYIAPTYANGALPPVVARIQSNLDVFTPKVMQTYATGNASVLLTQKKSDTPPLDLPLAGRSGKVGYFVTDSSVGLKVTFDGTTAEVPSSINFGYKRKEFSWIPVGVPPSGQGCDGKTLSEANKAAIAESAAAAVEKTMPEATAQQKQAAAAQIPVDCYGDTLANVSLNSDIETPNTTGLQLDQFFATGTAARNLAATNETVRNGFTATLIGAIAAKSALTASLGSNSLRAGVNVALLVNVTAINDEPVIISLTGAMVADVKVGEISQQVSSVVLHKADLKAGGVPLVVTFDLTNLTANAVVKVAWIGPSQGAAPVPIGDPIMVQ